MNQGNCTWEQTTHSQGRCWIVRSPTSLDFGSEYKILHLTHHIYINRMVTLFWSIYFNKCTIKYFSMCMYRLPNTNDICVFGTRHSSIIFFLLCEFIGKTLPFRPSYDWSFSEEKEKWVRISDKQQYKKKLRTNEKRAFEKQPREQKVQHL